MQVGEPGPRLASLKQVESEHIRRVLDACGGRHSEAARVLGISRATLWRKLRELDAAGARSDPLAAG